MSVVNVHDAKTNFSKLLDRAHAGEEIILAKGGVPFARLVPLEEVRERQPGRYVGGVPDSFFEDLPAEELGAWER
jgi:prevent-host-death family protein